VFAAGELLQARANVGDQAAKMLLEQGLPIPAGDFSAMLRERFAVHSRANEWLMLDGSPRSDAQIDAIAAMGNPPKKQS
jgi:hypothetical protein